MQSSATVEVHLILKKENSFVAVLLLMSAEKIYLYSFQSRTNTELQLEDLFLKIFP